MPCGKAAGKRPVQSTHIRSHECVLRAAGNLGGSAARSSIEQHPFHLHGHHFCIGQQSWAKHSTAASTFNLVNPMDRNTQTVSKGGWAVIRFVVRHLLLCMYSL